MTAPDSVDLATRVMLAEYDRLKAEQLARIGFRDNLIYAALIASAAIASTTLAQSAVFLLLLPPAAVLLGWTYLINDEKVSAAGRYLRVELGPALAEVTGQPVFGWEHQGTDPGRVRRKRYQLAADLLAFGVLPAAALTVFWVCGPSSVLLLAVSALETAALSILAAEIIRYAELSTDTEQAAQRGREPAR